MRVEASTSAMSPRGHDLADEQDLGVAIERQARRSTSSSASITRWATAAVAGLEREQRVAQPMADEIRDLGQPVFQEAGLDLSHRP